jgi:type I restriction enzyme S subunit
VSEWKAARIGDICKSANGRAFKPTEWDTEGAPIIRIQNLKNDNAPFNYFRGEIEPRFRVQHGDLLFAWSGTPGTSFGAHIWHGGDAVLNQHIFNLHFDRTKIDERFFCYALNRNVADYVAKAQGGVGLAHITKGKFEDSFVPLPDIAEQRAVVAEIEKQFSRLDEAVAGLKRVKANLKRYKAAILKAAVEGRLVPTEADLARREGRGYETGAQLLQRILDTRRSQWQGKGKYKEPAAPDTTTLPELPEGWGRASLDALSWDSAYGTSEKCSYENNGPAVLRIPNVQNGMVDLGDLKFASSTFALPVDAAVTVGDMLIIRTNGSKSLIGKAAVVLGSPTKTLSYASYLIRFRLTRIGSLPDWVSVVWQTPQIRSWIEAHAATSAGQHNVSMTTLATAAIPIPSLAEQHRIVAEVDRLLSIAREAEAEVETNLNRAQSLRQAILSKAFCGVPQ